MSTRSSSPTSLSRNVSLVRFASTAIFSDSSTKSMRTFFPATLSLFAFVQLRRQMSDDDGDDDVVLRNTSTGTWRQP